VQRASFGHLRLVVDEPHPRPAVGGGDGGDSQGPQVDSWTIVEGAITRIAGERRVVEIAGWRCHRFTKVGGRARQLAPDWICEPAENDRAAQLARYAGPGIGYVWLIDASTRTIDVYRFVSGAYSHITTSQGDASLRAEPFEAFAIDLSSVWSDTNE
jgi:hypothetical protein